MIKVEEVFVSTKAKVNFLKALIRLAKCDGNVDEKEKIFFIQAAQNLGIDTDATKEVEEAWKQDEIQVYFDTMREKMMTLIQLFQISWVDEVIADAEIAEIRKIACELQVQEEMEKKIEDWFNEGLAWARKGDTLLNV